MESSYVAHNQDDTYSFDRFVADLLWAAGCDVTLPRVLPAYIKATIFSPHGNQDVRIVPILNDKLKQEVDLFQLTLSGIRDLIIITETELPQKFQTDAGEIGTVSVSTLIDQVFVKERMHTYCSRLLRTRLARDEDQSHEDYEPAVDYTPEDDYETGHVYASYLRDHNPEESGPLDRWPQRRSPQDSGLKSVGDALSSFLEDDGKILCCLTGGFGTGKTVESLLLTKRLAKSNVRCKDKPVLPLFVNLSGSAARPLNEAVSDAIASTYGCRMPAHIGRMLRWLQRYRTVVAILDSIDEQLELHARALTQLWYDLLEMPRNGIKTIVSYRYDMFENWEVERQTITQGIGPGFRCLALSAPCAPQRPTTRQLTCCS